LFTAPADFKPRNLRLSQTSSDCVRLVWDNPYTDVEANYQVYIYMLLFVLLIRVLIQVDEAYCTLWTIHGEDNCQ